MVHVSKAIKKIEGGQRYHTSMFLIFLCRAFGRNNFLTLLYRFETFKYRWQPGAGQGFGEGFHRMSNFYLTSCAGAFEVGKWDVRQITIARPG